MAFTCEYIAEIVFMALAFFTFIKLVSADVYLNHHRVLPSIAAVVMIHDFYIVIAPLMPDAASKYMIYELSDMCSMVIIYSLFFYLLIVRKPRFYRWILAVTMVVMIVFCAWNLISNQGGIEYSVVAEMSTVAIIALGSIYTALMTESKKLFDAEDKSISVLMLGAFIVALTGYLFHAIFIDAHWIVGFACAIDCVIYYYMADTNRIEDTSVVLSNAVFNFVGSPMVIVNSHFYISDANNAGKKAFPNGKNVGFAFEDGDIQKRFLLLQKLVEKNENDREFYAEKEWYRVHWAAVAGRKGPKGYIVTCINVTSQHNQIVMAKEETAEKSQFLAHMSHELRSPLHAIIGVSDILLEKHDMTTKNRGLVAHIKKASDGLLGLVDAILDFSKLEAGKFSFAEKNYSIESMLEELAYNTIVNLQSKPVDFSLSIDTKYPKKLYGDKTRVREIFQNVLSNSVKFTDRGSIRATISIEEVDDEQVHITFKVADTGQGMSPDQLKEIFKEYKTISDGVSIEGTGLGLSITKQLIELMGGSIHAESDGISGATFIGDFYQKIGDIETCEPITFNRRNVMKSANGFSSASARVEWVYPQAKILVADDMKINQEILKQLLHPWKCQVVCVADGGAAVEAVKEHNFDLILLDQMMSPMGGLEAADEIRKFSNVPIALVTANTEDNVQGLLDDHKIDDFVGKPIHADQIARVIDQYLPAEYRQKNLDETVSTAPQRNDVANLSVYIKTLETFVREMQPLLLHLPKYMKEDRDLFKIKVHGIKGVSNQIGRDSFAEQAEIMEMAAKAEHWAYVEKHIDEFLTGLCDVVEDVTNELTSLTPEDTVVEDEAAPKEKPISVDTEKVDDIFAELLTAFDAFDISAIEQGINNLENVSMNRDQTKVFTSVIDAYDNLEYDKGSSVLSEYLNKNS